MLLASFKTMVRAGVERLGYQIIKAEPPREATSASPYGAVIPIANYSPWAADAQFMETYRRARDHTLVDVYRCYELWTLVAQSAKLDGDLLEVGSWRGGSGAIIARSAELSAKSGTVYLCDTFAGVVKASWRDRFYRGGEHQDTSRDVVERLLTDLDLRNVTILQGVFPEDTAAALEHCRFRFCHIDVDVYQSAMETQSWVWPRLARGGMVVFDDYGFEPCQGITEYVDAQRSLPDRMVIHNLNGHAIVMKLS